MYNKEGNVVKFFHQYHDKRDVQELKQTKKKEKS